MTSDETLKENTYDGLTYICPTWEQMGRHTFSLAKNIIDSGRQFDRVVALAKGGWTWSRTLVDYLGIDNLSSTRLKSYEDVDKKSRVKILQPLADPIDGENILIFDEVDDSGETVRKARQYIEVMGGRNIAIAALCYKPCSVPDFSAFSTDAWVVFPHERREFIDLSRKKWSATGLPDGEIRTRLVTIGLPVDEVDYFLAQPPLIRQAS